MSAARAPMVALGDCCHVVNGSTPGAGVLSHWVGDIVWATPTDLGKLDGIYVATSARTISQNALDSHNLTLCPPGSVVLSSRAPIGHLGIAQVPLCTNQGCKTLVPNDGVNSEYLYYSLLRAVPDLRAMGSGATFTEISKAQVEGFEIPLPGLIEQERIAAKVTRELAAVDAARRAAEERLTAAESLPAAYLREVFGSRTWQSRELHELCRAITDGTHLPPGFTDVGVPFLFVRNIVAGRIDFKVEKYISEETYNELTKRHRPERGDVLFSAVGSFGVAVVVRTDARFAFQRHIAHIKPDATRVDEDFLAYFLNSPDGRSQSEAVAMGGAQRTVTLTDLRKFRIPAPPLPEQHRTAADLSRRLEAAERLVTHCREELAAIETLPAAVLRAAFNGDS
jgi:type I restriction enzyme S subunit